MRPRVARRGLVRSARALAAAVLLALSSALALPATAQAQNVSEPPGEDLPDATTTTGRVAVGGSVTGAIGQAKDIDAFAVEMVQGLNYGIDVEGVDTSQGTLADPELLGVYRVPTGGGFDRIGSHTRDLDSGDGRNAQIAFTLGTLASGTFYLLVTSQYDTTGTYRLSVRVLHPGKPTNLSATANGSMQIDLSWDAPADDGGSAITGYKIEVSTTGGIRWTVLVPDTGNDDTEYSHTGLSPGDTRTYRVSAINVHGTSEASDSDYTTTPVEVTLHLSETSTLENDPAVTVTATAWPPSRVPYTVTVSASPVAPATVDDFELSTNRVLSFARNATESTGTVTIRMVDDDEREPNDVVRVSGTVSNAAIPAPDDVTLTILNDDTGPPPTVTSVVVASAPQSGNTYHWGETIVFTVTFDEPVRVTGRPGLEVGLDDPAGASGSTVQARFAGLSESERPSPGARPVPVSRHVHFAYTVQPFDRDTDGVRIGANALRLASGDRIRSDATGADAEFDHAAPGRLPGHRVDGEPAAPVAGAGIRFVDGNGHPLETRADGSHRLWVPEGGSARYGLRLNTRPAKSVVLSFHPQAGDVDLDVPRNYSSDRSIAPDEWAAKTVWVRVEAAQDGDAENDERVFENRAFSNDPNYHDLALPDVVAVEADDEPPCTLNPGDIWCGVVALGIQVLPGGDASYGFSPFFGQLSDDSGDRSFTYGTNTYTIGSLLREGGGGEAVLVIRLTSHLAEADRAKLVLHIGSASFAFSDASVSTDDYSSDENYLWDSDLDWSRLSYVILRLREASSAQRALQGRFVSPPERHDGKKRIKVQVEFSEPVEESPENVGEHGVEVEGGEVTSVSPVGGDAPDGAGTRSVGGRNAGQQDREVVWEFEIEPDSDGDLTISLDAGRPCGEPGAICTADGRSLSEGISTTVEGPDTGPPPLTASFEDMPEAHDGESAFRFRVAFSENIGISYRSLREDAFAVSGGRVTQGRRVDGRRDLFEMTVEPDGDGEVTVTLPAGRECSVSGAICTKGENRRQLTNTPTATVAGPAVETGPAGLTAQFVDMPAEHDGETAFKLRIAFSEEIRMSGRRLRSDVVAVSGGRATKARPVNGRKDLWKLTVRPDSLVEVTVTLAGGAACDSPGAVCTADGQALSNTISATVRGPVAVSVADARVREAAGATLDFAVSLSRAAAGPVSVTYATADGSATAGLDYTARQGKLRFAPGETEKTISVPVLDDAHDEGAETMQLRLSAASGAAIADGVATGTIENTDHMPAAWLARFGRTVTDQVLEAVEARLTAPRAAGAQARLAGQALPSWDGANDQAKAAANDNALGRALAARDREAMAAIRDWMAHAGTNDDRRGEGPEDRVQSRALTGRDFLTGTSFALTGGSAEAGGYAALWGRGAISRFDGREGDLTLDGEVTTGLMGADWAANRWTAGLAVGHARGTGGYREGGGCEEESCAGEVEATLTGLWPYAGLTLTDRLSAWAAAGYGAGELKLTPGGGSPFRADLTMAMGAAGMRGEVLTPPPEGGLALALKGDARFTRTVSEATKDAKGGNLAAATADVWLVRTGIEGSRRFAPGGDAAWMVLTPSFEIGVRLDGGDAETGLGVDLGGGLAFAAPKQGVALDLKARGLIAHESSGFREWGASASLTWDPRPTTDRGLALTLRQGWGGSPTGGMEALLGRETLAGLAANDDGDTTASAGRLEAELGYGIAMFDGGFTGTPHLGFGLSDTGRDYRLGWRLTSARRGDPGFEVGLDATRREAANADAEHGVMLRGAMRW